MTEKVAGEDIKDFHILNTSSFMAIVVSAVKSLKSLFDGLFEEVQNILFTVDDHEKRIQDLKNENENLQKQAFEINQKNLELEGRLERIEKLFQNQMSNSRVPASVE